MAIAGIVIVHSPQHQKPLLTILGGMASIFEASPASPEKIAASVEIPAEELTGFLKRLAELPQALDLELVFVNYEDDLDENGFIPTPPEAKKYD